MMFLFIYDFKNMQENSKDKGRNTESIYHMYFVIIALSSV